MNNVRSSLGLTRSPYLSCLSIAIRHNSYGTIFVAFLKINFLHCDEIVSTLINCFKGLGEGG